jgi:hypothetical protein
VDGLPGRAAFGAAAIDRRPRAWRVRVWSSWALGESGYPLATVPLPQVSQYFPAEGRAEDHRPRRPLPGHQQVQAGDGQPDADHRPAECDADADRLPDLLPGRAGERSVLHLHPLSDLPGLAQWLPCGRPGEQCIGPGNQPYFRPLNQATRGQIAKILSNAAGFYETIPSTQQTFEDVLPGTTFWVYIERIASRGYINGYACGGPNEPHIAPHNRPYFPPNASVTRAQLSKKDALTAGWTKTPTTQTFAEVAPDSTFYVYIERLATRGLISGYPCCGPIEPCGSGNRPYFRPYIEITRAQTAKIIANSFFPNCQTPQR